MRNSSTFAAFGLGVLCSMFALALFVQLAYPGGVKKLVVVTGDRLDLWSRTLEPGEPKPYRGELASLAGINVRDAALNEVFSGLNYPWAFEFVAPDVLLVTEFAGGIKLVNLSTGTASSVGSVPSLSKKSGTGQIGLLDVALHPQFGQNGIVYFSHAVDHPKHPDKAALAVTRARLDNNKLVDMKKILVARPFGNLPSNFGGAMVFDDQGYLYIGTGDRARREQAQNGKFLTGKILRLKDDGTVPSNNPFVGDKRYNNRIYALGIRNPQGLYFDDQSGQLYATEHGPLGGDEVNAINPARNYGWPLITYGSNYTTHRIGRGTRAPGLQQPLYYYLPSLAISPVEMYRGEMFPEWEGDLLVGTLKAKLVSKLDVVDGVARSDQRILNEMRGRVRDIKVADDGSIYFLLQEEGKIFRLSRDSTLESTPERDGRQIYNFACATCHSARDGVFPDTSDAAAWRPRLEQGRDVLRRNVVTGIGDMPAMGFCENCTDVEVEAALDYMLKKLRQ